MIDKHWHTDSECTTLTLGAHHIRGIPKRVYKHLSWWAYWSRIDSIGEQKKKQKKNSRLQTSVFVYMYIYINSSAIYDIVYIYTYVYMYAISIKCHLYLYIIRRLWWTYPQTCRSWFLRTLSQPRLITGNFKKFSILISESLNFQPVFPCVSCSFETDLVCNLTTLSQP